MTPTHRVIGNDAVTLDGIELHHFFDIGELVEQVFEANNMHAISILENSPEIGRFVRNTGMSQYVHLNNVEKI